MKGTRSAHAVTADVEQLWRAYSRAGRQARRSLRWSVAMAVGRKWISWDLLRQPRLEEEIPRRAPGISFFVPVQHGGLPMGPGEQLRGLPLQTRLIETDDEGNPLAHARLRVTLDGGPSLVLAIREAQGAWRMRARFRERHAWRAARLGFQRLAPAGTTAERLGRVVVASFGLLAASMRAGLPRFARRSPAASPLPDFVLAALSPRQLSSPAFWPTAAMGVLVCPLLAAAATAIVLQGLGVSLAALAFSMAAAVAIAWTGAATCGSVSVFAASVGALPLSTALAGLDGTLLDAANAGILDQLAAKPARDIALGGVPILTQAPAFGVACVDLGLVLLGIAMAAARRRPPIRPARGPRWAKVTAIIAACVGPGLVTGGSLLLEPHLSGSWPVLIALGLVGGAAFSACLALQAATRRRAVRAGGIYAGACLAIAMLLGASQGTLPALLLLAVVVHVLLNGTFYALAYLAAEALGGNWIGALACSLQGAGGYTTFLILKDAVI